jgi:hypothetical protein
MSPNKIFYTTYHDRDSSRTMQPFLDKFGFTATVIPLHTFLHPCHREGECLFKTVASDISKNRSSKRQRTGATTKEVLTFDSIYLLRISAKQ